MLLQIPKTFKVYWQEITLNNLVQINYIHCIIFIVDENIYGI